MCLRSCNKIIKHKKIKNVFNKIFYVIQYVIQ